MQTRQANRGRHRSRKQTGASARQRFGAREYPEGLGGQQPFGNAALSPAWSDTERGDKNGKGSTAVQQKNKGKPPHPAAPPVGGPAGKTVSPVYQTLPAMPSRAVRAAGPSGRRAVFHRAARSRRWPSNNPPNPRRRNGCLPSSQPACPVPGLGRPARR